MRRVLLLVLVLCAAAAACLAFGSRVFARQVQARQQTTAPKTPVAAQPAGQQTPARPTPTKRPPIIPPGMRLLSLKEGHGLAENMAWADDEEGLTPDCSHLVHTLYEQAGYPYPYASSTDLYRGAGHAHFLRVRYPHAGDMIVWPGHAGIVVNPTEHSFFSTTSSGAQTQDYTSPYWRARGHAHFYRYLVKKSKNKGKTGLKDVKQQEFITKVPD